MSAYKIEKITIDTCQKHVDEWEAQLKKFHTVKAYVAKVLDFTIKRVFLQTNSFTHVDIPVNVPKKLIDWLIEAVRKNTILECKK